MRIPELIKIPLVIVGVIILFVILSKLSVSSSRKLPRKQYQRITSLIEQSGQWNISSNQNENPVIKLVHATYALAIARTVRHLTNNDGDIAKSTGIDMEEFTYHLEKQQKRAIQDILHTCPVLEPSSGFGVYAAGWV